MRHKIPIIILSVLLACVTALGQTSYKGLTPGRSTKAQVQRVLGLPVTKVNETLFEYRPQPLTSKIYVQYGEDSVVEKIEARCRMANSSCNDLARSLSLRLRETSETAKTPADANGKVAAYFGPPLYVVTTIDNESEVVENQQVPARISFYSRELYEAAAGKAKLANAAERAGAGLSDVAPTRPSTSSGVATDSSGRATAAITRTMPSGGGRAPATTTRPQSSAARPLTRAPIASADPREGPGAIEMTPTEDEEKEVPMSGAELLKFVGRYEFISSNDPTLKEAIVEMVGGRLRIKIGGAGYTLASTGTANIVSGHDEGKQFSFKVSGSSRIVIRFTVSEGMVQQMFFSEDNGQETTFAVGVPKP